MDVYMFVSFCWVNSKKRNMCHFPISLLFSETLFITFEDRENYFIFINVQHKPAQRFAAKLISYFFLPLNLVVLVQFAGVIFYIFACHSNNTFHLHIRSVDSTVCSRLVFAYNCMHLCGVVFLLNFVFFIQEIIFFSLYLARNTFDFSIKKEWQKDIDASTLFERTYFIHSWYKFALHTWYNLLLIEYDQIQKKKMNCIASKKNKSNYAKKWCRSKKNVAVFSLARDGLIGFHRNLSIYNVCCCIHYIHRILFVCFEFIFIFIQFSFTICVRIKLIRCKK